MYLAYTVHIWHGKVFRFLTLISKVKVKYTIDLCYGLVSANFSHFSSDGINISYNDSVCCVNYKEDFRAPI